MLGRTVLVSLYLVVPTVGICPHKEIGLLRWSHESSWPGGTKPIGGDSVEIIDGFLLDESPPPLHSIIIQKTGRLVWSPDVEVNLTVDYILIFGRLDIGSEDCLYDKKTRILLTGVRGQYTVPEFDEKFIGVPAGGTLELHGAPKLSWTKITRTLPKLNLYSGLLYQHSTHKDKKRHDWKAGLYVYVIDGNTGEVTEHDGFYLGGDDEWWRNNDSPKLIHFLDAIPEGRFVMMAVHISLIRSSSTAAKMTGIYEAVERLAFGDGHTGQSMMRNVQPKDAYAMITRKGHVHVTKEARVPFEDQDVQMVTLTHTSWSSGFKLTAISSIDNTDVQKCFVDFKIITTEGAYPILDVIDDVSSWKPGDRVVITSTDFDWRQAEEARVIYCPECKNNQVKIDLEPQFMHWGEIIDGVDERAEVALLTRNVVIEGSVQPSCPTSNNNCDIFDWDTFGGHIKIMKRFGNVHIEGVELYHMGQQTEEGHYPVHFHMAEDVDEKGGYSQPAYVRGSSIHESFARCITIHGTHGLQVKDTVGHKILGHCFFLEDGGEKRTLLEGNLGSSTMYGGLIPSDTRALATFWITNPQTRLRNNVAAGSQGTGFWFIFPDAPVGTSAGRGFMAEHEARRTAITEFSNNVAHSNPNAGLFIDHRLAADGFIYNNNGYDPRVNPLDKLSGKAKVEIYRLTAYKNRYQNAWLRGGWIVVNQSSFADSAIGLTLARGSEQEQFLMNSIIVGETRNVGEPYKFYDKSKEAYIYLPRSYPLDYQLQTPIQGFNFYDGPVHISNVWFSGFIENENRTAGAIGFLRNNAYASSPVSSTRDIHFSFFDGPTTGNRVYDGDSRVSGFTDNDGNKEATFRDLDGSVTGVRNAQVIKPGEFYTTAHCIHKTPWNMAICPHRYGKIAVSKKNREDEEGKTQPVMVRDDIPEVYESMTGLYAADFNVVLGGSHSYTLHWSHYIPDTITMYGWGIENQYHVRIGVCLPRYAEFDLYSYYPKWLPSLSSWIQAGSLEELDGDLSGKKYYWDPDNGLLFVKFQHFHKRMENTTTDCPHGKCPMVRITINKGDRREADCRKQAYGQYRRAPLEPLNFPIKGNTAVRTVYPPENFGAGPTRTSPAHMSLEQKITTSQMEWSRWGPCSKTCGGGFRTRRRDCEAGSCPGPLVEKKECATRFCPENGGFSPWSEWTVCFKLAGCQGFQRRSRDCVDPSPHNGGEYCEGAVEQVRPCETC